MSIIYDKNIYICVTKDIESRPLAITEFDEKLWLGVIDQATVGRDGALVFRLRNGSEVIA
jgi:hypothetical protein